MRVIDFILIVAIVLLSAVSIGNAITMEKENKALKEKIASIEGEQEEKDVVFAKFFLFSTAHTLRRMDNDFIEKLIYEKGAASIFNQIPKDAQKEAAKQLGETYKNMSFDLTL